MLRILKYLSKAEIGQMLIALVTIVGQVYFDLKLPDYMSDITTLVETPGSAMSDIWIAGGKMLLISLGSVACAIVTGYISARVGSSFTQRLRSLEFRKVESYGPAEMSKFSTASLITRSTNDVTQIQMFITMGLMMIVKAPIMAVWAVCKIAGEGFEWTLATGIAVVILLAAIVIMMAMVMPKFKAMQRLTDNINLVARENLTGLRVVRAYNAEDYQEAKFTEANKEPHRHPAVHQSCHGHHDAVDEYHHERPDARRLLDRRVPDRRRRPDGQAQRVLQHGRVLQLLRAGHHELPAAEYGVRALAASRRVRAARARSHRHRADRRERHQDRRRRGASGRRENRHRRVPQRELHLPRLTRGDARRHRLHRRKGPDRRVHRLDRLRQIVPHQPRAAFLRRHAQARCSSTAWTCATTS